MRWFTADHHFGHSRIIGFCGRPFHEVGEMNEALTKAHNAVVGADDDVFILGDLALGDRASLLPLLGQSLNGRLHLVPGNHDTCHPMAYGYEQAAASYRNAGFLIEPVEVEVDIGGTTVLLCHFPPQGDSGRRDRYRDFRPAADTRGNARWILHGHVHEKWRQRGRWINVGVDAWAGAAGERGGDRSTGSGWREAERAGEVGLIGGPVTPCVEVDLVSCPFRPSDQHLGKRIVEGDFCYVSHEAGRTKDVRPGGIRTCTRCTRRPRCRSIERSRRFTRGAAGWAAARLGTALLACFCNLE